MSHQEFDISDGRIADQLRGAAVEFAAGKKTQEEFVGDLLALEARKLRPYGLTLAVSQTADGWLAVVMKHSATGRLCAAFEFLPEKPQFRRFSRLSEYPPVLRSRPSRSGALRTTGRSLS